jgi:hypothetical protein
MSVDWNKVQIVISPIKNFEDINKRLQESFGYAFVREIFNFTIPQLVRYTQVSMGGDPQGRYKESTQRLVRIYTELQKAGVKNVLDLMTHAETRQRLETFSGKSRSNALDIVSVLKFLIYWLIPGKKYMSGLVRKTPDITHTLKVLADLEIRTNLDLLQKGINPTGRKSLVTASGLSEDVIEEMVNRADFSRMPWTSKATISNIIGAGYLNLAQLASADPEKLIEDYYHYGKSIGKNLKLGNEIENSHRIAKVIPAILRRE